MRFFKPSIFYPKNDIDDEIKMKEVWENYELYLSKVRHLLNNTLLEIYKKSDRFHDFDIASINHIMKKKKKHQINIFFDSQFSDDKFEVLFLDVHSFHIINSELYWEEIIMCEIGVVGDYNYIYFYLVNECEIHIRFKGIRFKHYKK
jgi:hypothetical protein